MKPKVWVMLALLIGSAELNCYAQFLKNLVPDHLGVQYAGSIGWVSVGTGYDLFRSRIRTGLHYGYVPKDFGGELHILSASVYYQPLKIKISRTAAVHPMDTGIKAAYHFGDQFYLNWPERFPRGYYWWKSALRLHLAIGASVTRELKNAGSVKAVTGYVELNTNDLYLVSYVLNPTVLTITDIIKVGCGIRIQF